MPETGQELGQNLRGFRRFYSSLGLLLRTADGLMGDQGWPSAFGPICISDISYSVASASIWLPRELQRMYGSERRPDLLAMIAILLDDYERDYRLAEPVVTASYFVYPGGVPKKSSTLYAGAQWFARLAAPSDGTPHNVGTTHRLWKKELKWTSMEVFARPLVAVTDESRLQELVIAPLLALLAGVPLTDQATQPQPAIFDRMEPETRGEVAGG